MAKSRRWARDDVALWAFFSLTAMSETLSVSRLALHLGLHKFRAVLMDATIRVTSEALRHAEYRGKKQEQKLALHAW